MAKFFIDRPIFAWVIALFIMVMGGVAITQLPISQYPPVAPPSIVINASYPGASAQTLEDSVLSVIEREMNGSPGLIYMESVAQADGSGSITLSFQPGTNADLAQVDVQNRLSRASPRLPSTVTQQGVRVDKSGSNFLLFTMLSSSNPETDTVALGDYASRNVVPELLRLKGIGQAQLFGTERAMRIWIDPAKMLSFNISTAEITAAIRAQNAQVASGTIGDLPNLSGQGISATVVVSGQLSTVEQFSNIILRANADGSTVRLKGVARVELGGQAYATAAPLNGKPARGLCGQLLPRGTALAAAKALGIPRRHRPLQDARPCSDQGRLHAPQHPHRRRGAQRFSAPAGAPSGAVARHALAHRHRRRTDSAALGARLRPGQTPACLGTGGQRQQVF